MPWAFEYSKAFISKFNILDDANKMAVRKRVAEIKRLKEPMSQGGKYFNGWSYKCNNGNIIVVKFADDNRIVFTDIAK